MKNEKFANFLDEAKKDAWISFRNIIKIILGNYKSPDYRNIVGKNVGKVQGFGM